LGIALWAISAEISQEDYSYLYEVLQLLNNDETRNLPAKLDTLK
jgi:hypothetical protein